MIDLDITNTELMKKANISSFTFYKLKSSYNVTINILL